jgi:hypothetical protein
MMDGMNIGGHAIDTIDVADASENLVRMASACHLAAEGLQKMEGHSAIYAEALSYLMNRLRDDAENLASLANGRATRWVTA